MSGRIAALLWGGFVLVLLVAPLLDPALALVLLAEVAGGALVGWTVQVHP